MSRQLGSQLAVRSLRPCHHPENEVLVLVRGRVEGGLSQQIVDRCSVISAEGWDRREHGFTDEEAVTGRYVPHVVPLHSIETDVHLVAWIHRKEAVIVDTGLK